MKILDVVRHPDLGELKFGLLDKNASDELIGAISQLLTECATNLAEENGGHVPNEIVFNRILKYYTTVKSIRDVANKDTFRFFLLKNSDLIATILISKLTGIVMPEFTHGIHENYRHKHDDLTQFKHSIFNTAVRKHLRRKGLASLLLDLITKHRSGLLSGNGFYARAEPTEHEIWRKLGFEHKVSLDEYFQNPVLTERTSNILDFNSKFKCTCSDENLQILYNNEKLKYFGFVRDF